LSDTSRYVTVSIPKAIAGKIDFLIDELGYWPSRSAFVREACLEKISTEERRLRGLRGSG
jgi:Arc/MetJ-type ribon-helix-helix transcriptional regulator